MFLIDIYGLYLFGLVKYIFGRVPAQRATGDFEILRALQNTILKRLWGGWDSGLDM